MGESSRFKLSTVNDEDVQWVCRVMKLPSDAFSGANGDDPRLGILKSNETLDIEACPGSGKTTLLVAKLAILARKWTDGRRGLCVLSHTNVARQEIEKRLGDTPEGRRLLSYPHFVGTIHGFVNQFLALPWLRSKAWPITMIDNDVTLSRRWRYLSPKVRYGLSKSPYDARRNLIVRSPDFGVGTVKWSKGNLRKTTKTYQQIQVVCEKTSKEGYFCHDEMFIWANELLDHVPDIKKIVRGRFPVVFIDEVQDNSETQSALLFRLFMDGEDPVVRQRFGDSNQAIFSSDDDGMGATTDIFPDPDIRKDMPNSHRFGQDVADIVNPFAPEPPGLIGQGPGNERIKANTASKHAIFLFDDKTVFNVLPMYAQYLLEVFSDKDLQRGIFTAVGAIHKVGEDDHIPRSVCHYWSDYIPGLTSIASRPNKFCEYVQAGRRLACKSGEAHGIVEGIAEGILRLVWMLNPGADLANRRRKHRYVLELLDNQPELKARYLDVVVALTVDWDGPVAEEWETRWLPSIVEIAETIADVPLESRQDTVQGFLEWSIVDDSKEEKIKLEQRDNVFRYPPSAPKVQIQVGSIHSVKGETHTATLVLDTFFRAHNLAKLKPWLLGKKLGKGTENLSTIKRLKQHYVAMTRPTHLLCLAMREDAFKANEIDKLKSCWRVAWVKGTDMMWL
jgi:DNA helicase-2/ATP-dependent DNA helicase PcrA